MPSPGRSRRMPAAVSSSCRHPARAAPGACAGWQRTALSSRPIRPSTKRKPTVTRRSGSRSASLSPAGCGSAGPAAVTCRPEPSAAWNTARRCRRNSGARRRSTGRERRRSRGCRRKSPAWNSSFRAERRHRVSWRGRSGRALAPGRRARNSPRWNCCGWRNSIVCSGRYSPAMPRSEHPSPSRSRRIALRRHSNAGSR